MASQSIRIEDLRPTQVNDILIDVDARINGASFIHVVDPHEIVNFCCPLPETGSVVEIDTNEIMAHQVGCYDLFFRSNQKPVLSDEYLKEAHRVLLAIQHDFGRDYDKVSMIEELLAAAGLSSQRLRDLSSSQDLYALEHDDIRTLLAVRLGLHSFASERFSSIFRSQLARGFLGAEPAIQCVMQEFDENKSKYELIYELLGTGPDSERQNDRNDALAIARIMYANQALEKQFLEGRLKNRQLILYCSSAPRSKRLRGHLVRKSLLPVIDGKPMNFLRETNHLYLWALYRPEILSSNSLHEAREKLSYLKDVLVSARKRGHEHGGERCKACGTDNVDFTCVKRDLCENLEKIREDCSKSAAVQQASELIVKLRTFEELSVSVPEAEATRFSSLLSVLDRLRGKSKDVDTILTKAIDIQSVAAARGELAKVIDENIFGEPTESLDCVTSTLQFLPYGMKFSSAPHAEVWKSMQSFFANHVSGSMRQTGELPSSDSAKAHLIDAVNRFIALDEDYSPGRSRDHELLRALVYLSLCTRKTAKLAFENLARLLESQDDTSDLYCAAIWAGRRCGMYESTEAISKKAIRQFPDDERLMHGRQLNLFSWLTAEPDMCPFSLGDSVSFCEDLIVVFEKSGVYPDLLPVLYNNLAYESCLDHHEPCFSLSRARKAIEELKRICPRDTWLPENPEFHHTEAELELGEAIHLHGIDEEEAARDKIKHAFQAARAAFYEFPAKTEHRITVESIIQFGLQLDIRFPMPIGRHRD